MNVIQSLCGRQLSWTDKSFNAMPFSIPRRSIMRCYESLFFLYIGRVANQHQPIRWILLDCLERWTVSLVPRTWLSVLGKWRKGTCLGTDKTRVASRKFQCSLLCKVNWDCLYASESKRYLQMLLTADQVAYFVNWTNVENTKISDSIDRKIVCQEPM